MARINIDDRLYADPRFKALCRLTGSEEIALGRMVLVFRMAQEYFCQDSKFIPCDIWDLQGFDHVEKVGLAERHEAGIYVKGSSESFDWLLKRKAAAKAGGQKSAQARKQKYGSAQPNNCANIEANSKQTRSTTRSKRSTSSNPLTLTLTPTLTLNTYTSNKPSVHKADDGDEKDSMANAIVNVWNQTLTSVLPPVSKLTDKRKKLLGAQLKKYPDIEHWQQTCDKVKASDFLTGRSSEWKCNFDWVLNENNRTKILEGNYDNKGSSNFYKEPERRWLEIPTGDKQ